MIFLVPCCIYIQFVLIVMADEATNIHILNLLKIDNVFDDLMQLFNFTQIVGLR